jgi:glycosyltransferase involved in cell wall biosynthesis
VISICCPTRTRPGNMRRLVESIHATATTPVEVVFRIDLDDAESIAAAVELGMYNSVRHVVAERGVLSDSWNDAAAVASGEILMMCGDDIVFRTPGWDERVTEAFAQVPDRIALVYGNDLLQHERLATHPFIHRNWYDAVGYLVPNGFSCDWCDMWLNEVAIALGRRVYLHDVVTEHMHPVIGKARLDDNHRERLERGRRDNVTALYEARADERAADVEKLRTCMSPS